MSNQSLQIKLGLCIFLCIALVMYWLSQRDAQNHYSGVTNDYPNPSHPIPSVDAHSWRPPQPKSTMTNEELDRFILGRSFFSIPWVSAPSSTSSRDGVGPLFNANTCESCHQDRLNTKFSKPNQLPRALVFKLAQPNRHAQRGEGMLVEDPVYGSQIAINGVKGVPFEANVSVALEPSSVILKGGETVSLVRPIPVLNQLNYGALGDDTQVSIRQAPALHGLGLIERVPDTALLKHADPKDKNQDGISGRPNQVMDAVTQTLQIGRFGHKASQHSLLSQTADAAIHDMGLTNTFHPIESCTPTQTACLQAPKGRIIEHGEPDLTQPRLTAISYFVYNQILPRKKERSGDAVLGQAVFKNIGCQSCHVASLPTIDGVDIHPYSDFLLHDMGKALADHRREYLATTQEWRTAPLWQTGVKAQKGLHFLHDARARTVTEAIVWHGGEAKHSRDQFVNLPEEKRRALLNFLDTL